MKEKIKTTVAIALGLLFMFCAGAYGDGQLSGKVVDTMDSGGYTYILLEKAGEKTWVAAPRMKAVKGQNMAFQPGIEMQNFESKTLGRKFDRIIFSGGPLAGGAITPEAKGKVKAVSPVEKVKVQKAKGPDAYNIAEIYKGKVKLNGKTVSVRGKVVKVSSGIMKRNWIHLQDGTGNPQKGTHDLVVTAGKDLPEAGDTVTATGTLYKDKDFGMGYRYDVILEDAVIRR